MAKTQRKDNIELLRIVSMFMVTILHILGHGGILEQYEFGTFGHIFFWTIESFCIVAVNVFVLITGYFMTTSTVKLSRIFKLFLQVEFFSILCLITAKIIFHKSIGLKDFISAVFPFTSGTYWFVSAYIILIALVPLLNKLIKAMDQRQHLMTIILLTVLFCIIPTFMFWSRDILGNGYNFIWFIVLYLTAAYLRLYESCVTSNVKSKKNMVIYMVLILLGIVISQLIGVISVVFMGEIHGAN